MKHCVISLATRDRKYPGGLARLLESVQASGFTGQVLAWPPGQLPAGCPPHLDVPFAFKPYGFHAARQQGQDVVLWLDSSCVVLHSLDALFQQIETRGYLLFRNGTKQLGDWASDAALERLGLDRATARQLPEVNAAVLGLNLAHPVGVAFFEQWFGEAQHGVAFRGVPDGLGTLADYWNVKHQRANRASRHPGVRGHRHDQTVAGVVAHRLGLALAEAGLESCSYKSWRLKPQTVIVLDRRVARGGQRLVPLRRFKAEANGALWALLVRRLSVGRL